jgi:hypothetical protein
VARRTAPQRPATQAQRPCPQSRLPGAHACEHATPAHEGTRDAGAHPLGWQHDEATQSLSATHSVEGDCALPWSPRPATWAPPTLTAGGCSPPVPVDVEGCSTPPEWMLAGDGGEALGDKGPGSA